MTPSATSGEASLPPAILLRARLSPVELPVETERSRRSKSRSGRSGDSGVHEA